MNNTPEPGGQKMFCDAPLTPALQAGIDHVSGKLERPINWNVPTLKLFITSNYWFNPEDAIGDIRKFIANEEKSCSKCGTYEHVVDDHRCEEHARPEELR